MVEQLRLTVDAQSSGGADDEGVEPVENGVGGGIEGEGAPECGVEVVSVQQGPCGLVNPAVEEDVRALGGQRERCSRRGGGEYEQGQSGACGQRVVVLIERGGGLVGFLHARRVGDGGGLPVGTEGVVVEEVVPPQGAVDIE